MPLFKVGLTGGIGSGKSSAIRHFRSLGIEVLDADQIARQVVQPGQPALQAIAKVFGESALDATGALDRDWMRRQIFTDPDARVRLETITHPIIRQQIIQEMSASYETPYLLIDIPLLVEKNYQELFDAVLVVDCTPKQQLQRVRQRDGSDASLIKGIMAVQASREGRLKHATHVLDNSGTPEQLHLQVDQLHQEFLRLAGSPGT